MGHRLLGLLTIGQAPRDDLVAPLKSGLPENVSVIHAGALDGLSAEAIAARFAAPAGEASLLTRLADGRAVVVGGADFCRTLQSRVDALEAQGVEIIVLLCTGHFPTLTARRAWLVEPERVVSAMIGGFVGGKRVGVLGPLAEQQEQMIEKWSSLGATPLFAAASPYGPDSAIVEAAAALREKGAEALILDCAGYSVAHKRAIRRVFDGPIFVSTQALVAALSALL